MSYGSTIRGHTYPMTTVTRSRSSRRRSTGCVFCFSRAARQAPPSARNLRGRLRSTTRLRPFRSLQLEQIDTRDFKLSLKNESDNYMIGEAFAAPYADAPAALDRCKARHLCDYRTSPVLIIPTHYPKVKTIDTPWPLPYHRHTFVTGSSFGWYAPSCWFPKIV